MAGFGPWADLKAGDIAALRTVPKVVRDDWSETLAVVPRGQQVTETLCDVASCFDTSSDFSDDEFFVFARHGNDGSPFSVGLGIRRRAESESIILVRMNGPHLNRHTNTFPVRWHLPVAPHVHYLTARGIREQRGLPTKKQHGDQYALLTEAYRDIPGALRALARRTNIQTRTLSLDLWARSPIAERRAS